MGNSQKKNSTFNVLLLGLDNAGKTTILYTLKSGNVIETNQTIGYNVETIIHEDNEITIWDLAGAKPLRGLWKHFYNSANAIIFVIDTHDVNRLDEATEEIHRVASDKRFQNCSILVYANKIDLPKSLNQNDIKTRIKFDQLQQRKHIQECCAITGSGLLEGITWLMSSE